MIRHSRSVTTDFRERGTISGRGRKRHRCLLTVAGGCNAGCSGLQFPHLFAQLRETPRYGCVHAFRRLCTLLRRQCLCIIYAVRQLGKAGASDRRRSAVHLLFSRTANYAFACSLAWNMISSMYLKGSGTSVAGFTHTYHVTA